MQLTMMHQDNRTEGKMKVRSGREKPGNLKDSVHQNMQHRAVLQLVQPWSYTGFCECL